MYDCIEVQPLTEMPNNPEDDSTESDVVMGESDGDDALEEKIEWVMMNS